MVFFLSFCGSPGGERGDSRTPVREVKGEAEPAMHRFHFELDRDGLPLKRVFAPATERDSCFVVVSKVFPVRLSVYEARGADTLCLAVYPACVAANKGQKQAPSDNKTPESYPGPPFVITQIQDASAWRHDFGDGRGSIPAYGSWFMRLAVPVHTGIGIHGSTGNRESLKLGRGSEGCVRLLDEDIVHFRDHYAFVGMKVVILPEELESLPFEGRTLRQQAK